MVTIVAYTVAAQIAGFFLLTLAAKGENRDIGRAPCGLEARSLRARRAGARPDYPTKSHVRQMLGFKSVASARVILSGIEMVHMMREERAKFACISYLSRAE